MLRNCKLEFPLLDDFEKFDFFQKSLTGGFVTCVKRWFSHENRTHTFAKLDVTLLYSSCISKPLPVGDFEFLEDAEVRSIEKSLQQQPPSFPEPYHTMFESGTHGALLEVSVYGKSIGEDTVQTHKNTFFFC